MTETLTQFAFLAVDSTGAFRAIEYDLPETPFEWTVCLGGLALILVFGIRILLQDTAELNRFWRYFLMLLRMSALGGLIVVALNPAGTNTEACVSTVAGRNSHRPFIVDEVSGASG